jgi:hypothetical protein
MGRPVIYWELEARDAALRTGMEQGERRATTGLLNCWRRHSLERLTRRSLNHLRLPSSTACPEKIKWQLKRQF